MTIEALAFVWSKYKICSRSLCICKLPEFGVSERAPIRVLKITPFLNDISTDMCAPKFFLTAIRLRQLCICSFVILSLNLTCP